MEEAIPQVVLGVLGNATYDKVQLIWNKLRTGAEQLSAATVQEVVNKETGLDISEADAASIITEVKKSANNVILGGTGNSIGGGEGNVILGGSGNRIN